MDCVKSILLMTYHLGVDLNSTYYVVERSKSSKAAYPQSYPTVGHDINGGTLGTSKALEV